MIFSRTILSLTAACLLSHQTLAEPSDDIDARIEAVKAENIAMKKMLKLKQLEQENAELKTQLNIAAMPRLRGMRDRPNKSEGVRQSSSVDAVTPHTPASPAVPNESTWSGFYLGVHVGGAQGPWDLHGTANNAPALTNTHVIGTGALAGINAGYLWQAGRFVAGPELDFSVSSIGRDFSIAGAQYSAETRWLASFGGRVGYQHDNWLFFVGSGFAMSGLELTSSAISNAFQRPTNDGYVFSGGLQYAFRGNLSLRADYLYYSFRDKALPQTNLAIEPSMSVVRAGLSWRLE